MPYRAANCGLCAPENRMPYKASQRLASIPPAGPALKATIPACEFKGFIEGLLETFLPILATVSFPQQVIGFLRSEWLINAFMVLTKGSRLLASPFLAAPNQAKKAFRASEKIIQPL